MSVEHNLLARQCARHWEYSNWLLLSSNLYGISHSNGMERNELTGEIEHGEGAPNSAPL